MYISKKFSKLKIWFVRIIGSISMKSFKSESMNYKIYIMCLNYSYFWIIFNLSFLLISYKFLLLNIFRLNLCVDGCPRNLFLISLVSVLLTPIYHSMERFRELIAVNEFQDEGDIEET